MPHYIQYSAQGLITKKWQSVGPDTVEGLSNILTVDIDTFRAITKYHIVDTGVVREMTQAEIDQLDAYEAEQKAIAVEEALQRYEVSNLELLTALVQCINTRIPANPITKTELINVLKANR